MKGYALLGKNESGWRDFPVPEINPYGAIIETKIVSPCTTDIHLLETGAIDNLSLIGKVMGHEMAGIVVEVGSEVKDFKVGDRVLVSATQANFRSLEAQAGMSKLADTNQYWMDDPDRGGTFVEKYYLLDADMNLAHIPDSVTWEQAVMIPDMILTSFEGVRESNIEFGDSIVFIGIGPVGLMGVQAAAIRGAGKIFAVGSRQICFDVAKELGATDTIDYRDANYVEEILKLNGGPVDCVVLSSGTEDSLSIALQLVKRGGVVCNLATYYGHSSISIDIKAWEFGASDKTIIAPLCPGGRLLMEKMLKLIENGRIHPEKIVTHKFHGMNKLEDAMQLFINRDRSLIKPVVFFD
ncbi:zinc-binding dehydrogenase [Bacillus inaquosorum]|uniref:zinc-binding dehydrogenase n=1 Tax=Bacillus inaquosorum TaxID=483913 RepID=UPI002282A910|nr:zinc-binding dehydrogenase [Bacillus inaquosorum]MCY7939613.1 zinc-binding dehydrogenase [Bacillus inaquosorum]MCY8252312.1 zinc-binding dehydrogenase [Bacillus inaquosorum]